MAFLLTIYVVAQSFKLPLYKVRLSFSQTSLTGVALRFLVCFATTRGLVGICAGCLLDSLILMKKCPWGSRSSTALSVADCMLHINAMATGYAASVLTHIVARVSS